MVGWDGIKNLPLLEVKERAQYCSNTLQVHISTWCCVVGLEWRLTEDANTGIRMYDANEATDVVNVSR